ncbi:MAG: hypothetical protein Kow0056_13670 [Coriobacteriia bacterium]
MDLMRGLKAPFSGPSWVSKMLIGVVVTLVPILNFAFAGYLLEWQRRVAEGRDGELPDWDDLGRYWVRGAQMFVAALIYALPLIIIAGVGIVSVVLSAAAGVGDEAAAASVLGMCGAIGIAVVLGMVVGVFMFAAMTHFNFAQRFGAFFEFGEIWRRMRGNAGTYFGAFGMFIVINWVANLITTPFAAGGQTFVSPPALQYQPTTPDEMFAYLGASLLVAGVGIMFSMIVTVPVSFIQWHYFGQYMNKAYGYAPLEQAPYAPAPSPGQQAGPGAVPGGQDGAPYTGDTLPPPEETLPPPPPGA